MRAGPRISVEFGRRSREIRAADRSRPRHAASHEALATSCRRIETRSAGSSRRGASVIRGSSAPSRAVEDTEDSDLDILVHPTAETTLFDIGAIRHELGVLLGVRVDVLTPKALPQTFRDRALAEAVPV